MIPFDIEATDDIYYYIGNYLYNLIQPEVSGNLDVFKYILGKTVLGDI